MNMLSISVTIEQEDLDDAIWRLERIVMNLKIFKTENKPLKEYNFNLFDKDNGKQIAKAFIV